MDANFAPHLRNRNHVQRVMAEVMLALVPALFISLYSFGWGILINLLLAALAALAAEAAMLSLRHKPLQPFLTDGSVLVSALLFALALPPLMPWWLTVLGMLFAVIIAKHVFGGLGQNPFNPAMAGYALLLVSFPARLAHWPAWGQAQPGLLATLHYTLLGSLPDELNIDTLSSATTLDHLKSQLHLHYTWSEIQASPMYGSLGGLPWQWLNLAYLTGGLYLLARRLIGWQIPAGLLLAVAVAALVFNLYDGDRYPGPLFHLFTGATMIGAFFIATDPVTASTTPRGRFFYGAGIGLIMYLIRAFGAYPDGLAFAVLIMNAAVPLLDEHTRPRVYGHERSE